MKNTGESLRWARACMGLLLSMAAVAASAADGALVTFKNGETITEKELSPYLDRRTDLRQASRNYWGMETVLQEMALTRALVLEGIEMEVPRSEGKAQVRFDDIYAQGVATKKAPKCEKPADEAAARKFFDDNPQAFRIPVSERLSRVMLPHEQMIDNLPAMAWLHMAAKSIANGSKTFDEAAKYAADYYKLETQGDLGWVALNDETSIMRALSGALQGEMVGPVRDGDFAYLFLVVSKRDGRQMKWEEVATSVPVRALTYCRQETNKRLRDEMFKKYGVELNHAAIKELFKKPAEKPAEK